MTEQQAMEEQGYAPEEIKTAQLEENNLAQAQMLQQFQQRCVALNIETRRAQQRASVLEAENQRLRELLESMTQDESKADTKVVAEAD